MQSCTYPDRSSEATEINKSNVKKRVEEYQDPSAEEMLRAFFNANADDYMAYWDHNLSLKLANFHLSSEHMTKIQAVRDTKKEVRFDAEQNGRTFRFGVYPALSAFGDCIGVAVFAHDISQAKENEREVHRLANFDPLTGLANRTLLNDRLTQALLSSRRHGHSGAVICVDLDRFKTINDSLGHHAGDHVLRETALRLQGSRRDEDSVARISSNEFAWVLPDLSKDESLAARYAGRAAERFLQAFDTPIEVDKTDVRVRPSIGITVFSGSEPDAESILRYANAAMRRAKDISASPIQHYEQEMHRSATERLHVESRLHDAIKNGALEVYFQPQAQVSTNCYVGAEALLRWYDDELGNVPPSRFIPIAEETGLILELGQFVLEKVCQQIHDLNIWAIDRCRPRIAINISPVQFHMPDFVDGIAKAIKHWDIGPDQLELELTEGIVVENVDTTIEKMLQLKELGARIAIDDFGTGYSSLAYLNRMPLDILKIDQSFIRDINKGSTGTSIVASIITMAQMLGVDIVAEGVETKEHLDFLRSRACPTYQGFNYCRPMPGKQFENFVRAQMPTIAAAE